MKEAGKQGCRKLLTGVTLLTGMTLLASASFAAGLNTDPSAQIQERLDRVEQSIRQVLPPSKELRNLESQLEVAKKKGDDAAVTHLQEQIDELKESLLKKAALANADVKKMVLAKQKLSEQLAHSEGTASVAAAVIQPAAATGTGSISGVVTNSAGDSVSGGVTVTAHDPKDPDNPHSATTGADGAYKIEGIGAGDYQLYFDAPNGYVDEWYEDAPQDACATPVTLAAADSTVADINAVLAKRGSISGTVTGPDDKPVAGVDVCTDWFYCDSTAADGTYTIDGLAADTYSVRFNAPTDSGLLDEYYAEPIVLAAEAVKTGIDAQLEQGGSITGKVVDGTNGDADLADVTVSAYQCANTACDSYYWNTYSATTATNGTYTIDTLPLNTKYKVLFSGINNGIVDLVDQWFNNQGSFGNAGLVAVTSTTSVPDINATLTEGGSITGTVVDGTNDDADLANVTVRAYQCANTACDDYWNTYSATTAADGTYTIPGLPINASYKVRFDGTNNDTVDLAGQWYNNKAGFGSADKVDVTSTTPVPDINATLTAGGSISGTVVDGTNSNAPLAGVWVYVYQCANTACDNYLWYDDVQTAPAPAAAGDPEEGTYTIPGLPIDTSYKMYFSGINNGTVDLVGQWYNNKADIGSANIVLVNSATPVVPDIDATLAAKAVGTGKITGTVTNHGAPFKCADVDVYDADYYWTGSDYADYQGKYEVEDLPTGAYKVQADGRDVLSGAWYWQWYKCKDSFDKAKIVNVTSPDATTVDIKFPCGASILPALYPLLMNKQ